MSARSSPSLASWRGESVRSGFRGDRSLRVSMRWRSFDRPSPTRGREDHGFPADGCTSRVGTPQVPLRTVITRVPGLRPVRTSETSTPAGDQPRMGRVDVGDAPAHAPQPVLRRIRLLARPVRDLDDRGRRSGRTSAGPNPDASGRAPCRARAARRRARRPVRDPTVATTTWSIAVIDPVVVRTDSGRSLSQFEEEQPDAARRVGRRAGALPRQRRAGGRVAAFDLGDRLGLQRQPVEPAMHSGDVAGAEADAGEPLALRGEHRCGCGRRWRPRRSAPSVPASCCRA